MIVVCHKSNMKQLYLSHALFKKCFVTLRPDLESRSIFQLSLNLSTIKCD